MKTKSIQRLAAVCFSAFQLFSFSAWAQLTTTVYPGYTFQPGERFTMDKFNLLGQPTVVVSGSATGSVIAAGSIVASSLSTNATDRATLLGGWNGSSGDALRVSYNTNDLYLFSTGLGYKTNAIENVDIATNAAIAWSKIAVGTNVIAQTNLPLSLSSNILHGTGTNGTPVAVTVGAGLSLSNNTLTTSNTLFTTAEYAIAAGRTSTNHGLGVLPTWARWVLVCKTNDVGYVAGEELDVTGVEDAANDSGPQWTWGASSTNIFIVGYYATLNVNNGTNGLYVGLTEERWRLKGYARP